MPSGLAAATAAAAPPAAQVRACRHRDVRVTAQERKESRAAPSRSLAISTAGTQASISTDPPPPSATTRTSSRTQVPSREVRAEPASSQATVDASATAPPQPVQPADQGPTAQEIFDRLSGPVDPDIEAHVRRTLSRGQMYTPQQWREYIGSTCWMWSKANLHRYKSNTYWWWEGDNRRGGGRWYVGEASARY